MRIAYDKTDVDWLPTPNRVLWRLGVRPPMTLVTASYALIRHQDKVLVARHRTRGWDIPGGHLDPGEGGEAGAIRETKEETGATIGHLRFFAHQKVELFGSKPVDYGYPHPISYQMLFLAEVIEEGVFAEEEDMVERAFWTKDEALAGLRWSQRYRTLFKTGLLLLFEEQNAAVGN